MPRYDVPAGDRARAAVVRDTRTPAATASAGAFPSVRVRALEPVPPEVDALARVAAAVAPQPVDLLPLVLADVADPEVAGVAVEREPPRVAQPVRPDLGPGAVACRRTGCRRAPCTRVAPRSGFGSMRRILPSSVSSDCPLPPGGVARAGVAGAAAVAEPEVQVAVGAERELAAVVVGLRLLDRAGSSARRRGSALPPVHRVLVDLGVAVGVGVVRRRACVPSGEKASPRRPCSPPPAHPVAEVERPAWTTASPSRIDAHDRPACSVTYSVRVPGARRHGGQAARASAMLA